MEEFDVRAFLAIYGGRHGAWGPAMTAMTVLGSGWAGLALLPLIGWAKTRSFARALALAVATQAAIVWLLKLIFGRVRPWLAFGLPAPLGMPHDGSFPSGHAAGSFCVAAFFVSAVSLGEPRAARRVLFVSILAIPLAALVALSRVYLGAHFPSDVLAGALVGALIGTQAGRLYAQRARPVAAGITETALESGSDAWARGVECPSKKR